MSTPRGYLRFTDNFLQLFCEKNSDGTKKLRLKGNELYQRFQDRILPGDMLDVCYFLRDHPEINELDVSYNPVLDEGLEHLCQLIFKQENNLQHLNLASCDITDNGTKTLYSAAQENYIKLKTLRMCGNKVGPQGGYLVALAIPHIPTLEYLDMGDTDQTVYSIDCMFLKIYPSSLKIIDVSRPIPQTLTSQIDYDSIAASLSEIVRVSKYLVEIHVQKCGLDTHGVETLIEGLKQNTTLRHLDIGYNNICCPGAEFLAEWLKTRPQVIGLNIAGNSIGNYGGSALSFGIPYSKLRYLDISHNRIGEEMILHILDTVKKPYPLRYFFLWGNTITHRVNKRIQRMIKAKVLEQERIDVQVYCVDGVLQAAHYPADLYKHRYYGVMDHGCAVELKIKRNRMETPDDQPRALINFKHVDRYPAVEIPPKPQPAEPKKETNEEASIYTGSSGPFLCE